MPDESDRMNPDPAEEPDYSTLAIKDDRPRHPYVAQHPERDPSIREWTTPAGDVWTEEAQAWVSRSAFHALEGLYASLSPAATLHAIIALMHHLNPAHVAGDLAHRPEGAEAIDPATLDPSGAFLNFEELFGAELRPMLEQLEAIAERCPGCGRKHGEIGWVHTATGESVRVERMEASTVYFRRQLAPVKTGGWPDALPDVPPIPEPRWSEVEAMPRVRFEQLYVPGESVALLSPRESGRQP